MCSAESLRSMTWSCLTDLRIWMNGREESILTWPVCECFFLFFMNIKYLPFHGLWLTSLPLTTSEFSTPLGLFSSMGLISLFSIAQVWTWTRGPGRWEWRWTSTSRERALIPDLNRTITRYKHVQIHHSQPAIVQMSIYLHNTYSHV